jgi:GNAT superfamily N-acetyltransferase
MQIKFKVAKLEDSEAIGAMVISLTNEICKLTKAKHFDINIASTILRCRDLMSDGHYAAIIGEYQNEPIAVVTFTETYALYAGGKIGLIQEFYVLPEYRASGIGSSLVEQVKKYGKQHNWSCIELCTPPLPEFEKALTFYKKNGLNPVGGRKMRQALE